MQTVWLFPDTRTISSALLLLALILSLSACTKRLRSSQTANDQQSASSAQLGRINLNTASANELETLPGIGKGLAARIIEHREKYGAFRRREHLLMVRGISDQRYRALRDRVTVE